MKELRKFVANALEKHSQHHQEIYDLYELCLDEISNGESESNEIELCINSINEIINQK